MVEDILTKHNLCILNDTSFTYIHPATASPSAVDLSICSPNIFLDMQRKTLDDLCRSDHYPISITYGSIETSSAIPSWKLCKADWPSFSNEASELLGLIDSVPATPPWVLKRPHINYNIHYIFLQR